MAYAPDNPTQLTPPRVPLTDDRTGAISREWYRFFLSLLTATQDNLDAAEVGPDTSSLLASYDAMLDSLAQSVESAPDAISIATSLDSKVDMLAQSFGVTPPDLGGTVTSVAAYGGTTGLTFSGSPITTSGTLTLGGTLAVASGGTGQSSYTDGQLLIGNSAGNTLTKATLTAGTNVTITNGAGSITINASDAFTGTVTSVDVSGGTTGLTTSGGPITTSGTITLGGTLGVANGGTGATTLSSGYLVKGNGTSAVSASVAYDDGTHIGIGTTSPSALLTISRNGGGDIGALVSQTNSGNGTTGRYRATHGSGSAVNLEAGNGYVAVNATSASPLLLNTSNTERFRVESAGQWGIGGANYGTAGQVFTSGGPSAAPTWSTPTTGTVTSIDLTAGTGISVSGGPITTSGSITVTNSAPDQIVSLTGAGTTVITGTYPSFTITSNDAFVGTVTSVSGTGSVNGITLTGTVTSSGSLTLGGTLSNVSLTTQVTGTLPVGNGGTGTATAFTSGSIVFAGASGIYAQDNTNLNWDDTNNTLGVGRTAASNVRVYSKGGTTGGGAFSYYGENSAGTGCFGIRDDGGFYTGQAAISPYNLTTAAAANLVVAADYYLYRSTSSARYKKNIVDYDRGLADAMSLRPVYYEGRGQIDEGKRFAGFVAEEVYDAGLTEFVVLDEEGKPDALHYGNMTALLVKALQDAAQQIDSLTTRVAALER